MNMEMMPHPISTLSTSTSLDSWPWGSCPSLAAALDTVGPPPKLGSIVELALEACVEASCGYGQAGPEGMRVKELTLPPAYGSTGWPGWNRAGDLAGDGVDAGSWQADQLNYYPGPIPGSEWAHPKIHVICEPLELVKGLIFVIQRCRIFMTQDNNRITRSFVKIQY